MIFSNCISCVQTDNNLIFQAKIEAIKQEKESVAESILRTQFKMELLVYAQDRTYSHSLSESKREEQEEKDDQLQSLGSRSILCGKDNHATLEELMLHLKSYYKVSFCLEG